MCIGEEGIFKLTIIHFTLILFVFAYGYMVLATESYRVGLSSGRPLAGAYLTIVL
jgi:hypothetical protein